MTATRSTAMKQLGLGFSLSTKKTRKGVDAGASLTRAPTDSLTSHISVENLCHLAFSAASLVISDSAAEPKYA